MLSAGLRGACCGAPSASHYLGTLLGGRAPRDRKEVAMLVFYIDSEFKQTANRAARIANIFELPLDEPRQAARLFGPLATRGPLLRHGLVQTRFLRLPERAMAADSRLWRQGTNGEGDEGGDDK
jgi:hypothetical protein